MPVNGEERRVLGTITLGFRLQPRRSGLKVGLTPVRNFKEAALSGGISIGYAF